MDTLKMDIDALLGERWFPKETSFEEDITEYWGEWGVCSEVETLRGPGKEVDSFDPTAVRFSDEPIDVELMRRQHDNVAKVYTDFGAKVYYVEHQLEDRPNAVFCRDLMFMTPEGAIITRPGMAARRGEERYVAEALAKIGVPILKTIAGDGMFEGANAMWVDRHTCVVSTGSRCNRGGTQLVMTRSLFMQRRCLMTSLICSRKRATRFLRFPPARSNSEHWHATLLRWSLITFLWHKGIPVHRKCWTSMA